MEIEKNEFIRFLDLLVKKLEEKEEYKEEETIHGLTSLFLVNIYNEANGTKLKRINFNKKHDALELKHTNKQNMWKFYKNAYKNLRINQLKNNYIEMDKEKFYIDRIAWLEQDKKDLLEKIERLEKTIELLTLAYGEKIKSQHRIDPREKSRTD
jgi:hypothetical protein